MASVTLTFQSPEPITFRGREVFRLVCTASDGSDMPTAIFGFQQTLVDPVTGQQQDEFSFVCSPYELSIFPANAPNPTQSPAYFRKSEIDILLPTVAMFETTKEEITSQVTRLISLLEALDTLSVTDVVVLGSPPTSSSSL